MAKVKDSAITILIRRKAVFEQKISEEKASLKGGHAAPGNPVGLRYIPGETRIARLARWEAVLIEIETELGSL